MSRTLTVQSEAERLSGRGVLFGLWLVAAVGLVFVVVAAVPYFRLTAEQFSEAVLQGRKMFAR